MKHFDMCTYLGCLEREHQYLQQRIPQSAAESSWQESATAAAVHQDMDMDTDQTNKSYHPGEGVCNNQVTMQPSSTATSQQYKSSETCSTCHICWRLQTYTQGCEECGGFALTRPCPICNGKCLAIWNREVDMSNEMKTAFWDGTCRLTRAEQEAHMLHNFVSNDVDTLVDAFNDLGRTS
ncbi:uncharacterized protein [Amphiura filiformis]|uniref:uncharacterized protein n=1 Tax=Amphiura filiformis TaxID=82378 RepID=UPI003B2199D9